MCLKMNNNQLDLLQNFNLNKLPKKLGITKINELIIQIEASHHKWLIPV